MAYLLYKSFSLYTFLSDYLNSGALNVDTGSVDALFNIYVFLLPWLILIILGILLVVMFKKKKPKLFYFVNIAIYLLSIGIYTYLFNTLTYMETNVIASQEAKLAMDIAFILTLSQLISAIISLIRSIGLDLKKFDFGKDLMELDVDDADNEEFEVNINLDSNSIKRNIRQKIRYSKYIYKENKLVINVTIVLIGLTIGFIIYMSTNVYNQKYKQGEIFATSEYAFGINKSYVTTLNSKGSEVTDKELLVLEFSSSKYGNNKYINTAKTEILINDSVYYPINNYNNYMKDLGTPYTNQELTNTLTKYLLVYEIPRTTNINSIIFRYLNDFKLGSTKIKPKYIKVKLSSFNLDKNKVSNDISLNELTILNERIYNNTSLLINSLEIAKEFASNYNFCIDKNDCYLSKEYIKPILNSNYDKVLLKVSGNITIDENITYDGINNLYDILNLFGRIEYKKDNKTYKISDLKKIDPKKYNDKNVYYIELNSDINNASEAYLIINVRNYEYKYKII